MKQAGGLLGLALAPPFAAQAERLASYAKTVEGVSTLQLKVNG
ncbi:(2Fe-2S)-binding protein, partial [Hymenobacter rigui]